MKKFILSFILLSTLGIAPLAAQKNIELSDIFAKPTFSAKGVPGFNSMNDGRYYCRLDQGQNLLRFEYASGKLVDTLVRRQDVINANNGNEINLYGYEWSADESKLLIAEQTESIYRHSTKSIYYVYDPATKKLLNPLKEKVRYATLSPDNSKMAFVRDNNLFYYDFKSNTEIRITKDGLENAIINGATDWVYEEEFAVYKGFSWSPDGNKIAYYRFDESKVPEFQMTIYGSLYPKQEKFKYPKAGEANSIVNVYVYDTKSELITEIQTGTETDMYLPRMQWTRDNNTLAVQRLNRLQNKLEILLGDAATGKTHVLYTETNAYYVDITDNLYFLNDKKTFLISSEKDGYNHIYLYDLKGKMVKQLTKGNWDVDDIYGVDEKSKKVYFTSSEVSATDRYVYAVGLNGKGKTQLSSGKGWHSASFNSDFTYFLDAYSNINTPPVYSLMNASGKVVRVLEDNAPLQAKLKDYHFSAYNFSTLKNSVGDEMNMYTLLPPDFDSTRKYPVLMFVYGGPGINTVLNRWSGGNNIWYQMLAQKGYIVVSVDGRGTGFRGEKYKKCTYLNLGKYEIEDQIFAAKTLASRPYVDPARIGIWGWSFGGYMAGLGISKGNDVFKAAISVAPVTNWRYYDNIYTERFMRTPQENGQNYDDNSPMNHVEKIKGKYLIIHGTADDNVHFQNAVEMVDMMIKKGVKFDSEFYPNKNHGIGGKETRMHLYERMTRFILEEL